MVAQPSNVLPCKLGDLSSETSEPMFKKQKSKSRAVKMAQQGCLAPLTDGMLKYMGQWQRGHLIQRGPL